MKIIINVPDTITTYLEKRYQEREDKDNLYGVGISDANFRRFIIDYLLEPSWCVSDPIGRDQINEIALLEILNKYSKAYQKEKKQNLTNKEKIEFTAYNLNDIIKKIKGAILINEKE